MKMPIFAHIIYVLFFCYTTLLFLRILSSWLPMEWQDNRLVRFLAFYTDPYLNFFRRFIPPLGGVLDLSPIIAFLVLKFLEMIVLGVFR